MPPAYQVEAWHSGVEQKSFAPQCSANGEFCFWCEFREQPGAAEDPCGELKALARILIDQKKELAVVVNAVREKYDIEIRPDIEYRNRFTGKTENAPEWTITSIQKHLVYSSEFPECTDLVIHHIHTSILMNLNSKMMNDEGNVDEASRKAFIETVRSLQQWKKALGAPSDAASLKK